MPDTLFKSYLEKGQTLRTYLIIRVLEVCQLTLFNGGEVEDTRLEAKDSPSEDRHTRGQGQGPRIQTQVFSKKGLQNFFSGDLQKKKNGLENFFSVDQQNFNHSKNSAVLEPRTGQFSRTWGFKAKDLTFEAKDFKMCCPRELHLCFWTRILNERAKCRLGFFVINSSRKKPLYFKSTWLLSQIYSPIITEISKLLTQGKVFQFCAMLKPLSGHLLAHI